MAPTHHVRLGDSEWLIWRDGLLRSTGFPASGLVRFAASACAAAADKYLDGTAEAEIYQAAFRKAAAATSTEVNRIAADPLLREAITWQSPAITGLLDSLLRNEEPIRRNAKRRYREEQLSRFWQRYCGKTETIGFFGPSLWVTWDPAVEHIAAVVGDGLVDQRQVFLEPWAIVAYGEWLAADPEIRRWLPPARLPHHNLVHRQVRRPALTPVELTAAETAVLGASDGRRPAVLIAADLAARPDLGFARAAEVESLLAELVDRKLLTWDANLPLNECSEAVLADRIAAIGEPGLRARAEIGLQRLEAARDAVSVAAGDPPALAEAIDSLGREFTEITGKEARRRSGMAYAGRGLCYEDTNRDLRMTIGTAFLDDLAPALDVVLQAARWLTVALADAYDRELRGLYQKFSADGRPPNLGDLWYPALRLFMGEGVKPLDAVMEDFISRWAKLLDLHGTPAEAREVNLSSRQLHEAVRGIFPANRPGWSMGRVHSPDLQICASSPQAVNEGNYLVVLGEMHAAIATMTGRLFNWSKPDPDRIMELAAQDYGNRRIMPLFPTVWPRNAGRTVPFEFANTDHFIGFAPASGVDLARVTSVAAIPVSLGEDGLIATVDGQDRPLIEVFSAFLTMVAADAFKLASATEHTPRITIDRLVIFRETWRTTADATDLAPIRDEAGEFLAARRWRRRLNLPERCFVKVSTETKPFFVDLTSPLYVSSFCAALRAARKAQNGDVAVTVTEMLPDVDQAWVSGPGGEQYFGELRLQITDPEPAATADPVRMTDATDQIPMSITHLSRT